MCEWQVYDWFLRPMVSLYAIRKACAKLAVQLCPLDGVVSAVSNHLEPQRDLRLRATVYDLQARRLHEQSGAIEVAANSCAEAFALALSESVADSPVYFVKLELHDAAGELLADNFYWLSPRLDDYEIVFHDDFRRFPANRPLAVPRQTPCLGELADLPPVELAVEAGNRGAHISVTVANPTDQLAFFIRVRVVGDAGEEILPVYWSDNYFSLLPGESKALRAELPGGATGRRQVVVDGWNIVPATVDVEG